MNHGACCRVLFYKLSPPNFKSKLRSQQVSNTFIKQQLPRLAPQFRVQDSSEVNTGSDLAQGYYHTKPIQGLYVFEFITKLMSVFTIEGWKDGAQTTEPCLHTYFQVIYPVVSILRLLFVFSSQPLCVRKVSHCRLL